MDVAELDEDPFADRPPPKSVWEATEEESLDEVRATIENKQDVNCPNPITLNTPLIIALKINHIEMANFLLSKGADVKPQNKCGDTALHWAALRGQEEMVRTMLSRGAKLDVVGEFGNTPLHFACKANHLKIVFMMLEARAAPL
ncbi:26S proteasome non-ATPase regulatory subunit 10-like [Selaginella moellendorffii]|uniref:26S proteasome non-ATPase regulatory subunit 10-like n=1 Tax=Selaginella moellendorffii TaxID=88036 RepID=UPI000D1C6DC6|nr:26S proteasome non-ATPase regulatory subunit 10-like [Selaginella moellendorffii]|eukprot:XP_024545145.1 26S proteasome non-ATPase regulatory subunit 10-like [Selaginella moellendorffii]